jgi:hypothetical protein
MLYKKGNQVDIFSILIKKANKYILGLLDIFNNIYRKLKENKIKNKKD